MVRDSGAERLRTDGQAAIVFECWRASARTANTRGRPRRDIVGVIFKEPVHASRGVSSLLLY